MNAGYPPLMTPEEVVVSGGTPKPHSHYFKPCPYKEIDVYRVLELFQVHDPVLAHIVKKALVAGGRGHKDIRRDVQDIFDSARRKLNMLDEDRVAMSEYK
jgi:hypothetical protein